MVKITAKESENRYGIHSIVYKNGRKKESEIEFRSNGHFYVLCCFSGGSCLSFEYDDLERAKERTERYLNNIHQFAGGAEITYK
jgi:hypothetical protein